MESLRAGPMQSWKTFESGLHTAHPRSGSLAGRVGVCLRTAVRNLFGTWDQFCGNSFKILMLRKIEGRRRGQQRMRWMASPTQWTWVWASSWRWWWAGKPGMLQSMGSQRVGLDWATELNWEAGGGGWFGGVIQAHYISCAFCFYHYDISSTSDHQGLHPRGWGPLPNSFSFGLSCKRYPARLRHYWRERESRYSVGTGNVDFAEGRCFPRIFFRLPWE